MPFLLDFSRFSLTRRRENAGPNAISGGGNYMFALGAEDGPQFGMAADTYTEAGNLYTELLGWQVGDRARVEQAIAALPDNGLQFDVLLQAPDELPAGLSWVFSVVAASWVVKTVLLSRLVTGRKKTFTLRLPAAEIFGGNLIFQLELAAM